MDDITIILSIFHGAFDVSRNIERIKSSKFIFIEFIIKNNSKQFKYSTFTPIKWS